MAGWLDDYGNVVDDDDDDCMHKQTMNVYVCIYNSYIFTANAGICCCYC